MKEPEKIRRAVDENRWPVYGKLHGDYHSDALKNTDAELRQQDVEMRRSLVDCCRRQGLAVIGYSGRDASIMAALEEALDEGGASRAACSGSSAARIRPIRRSPR